MATPADADIVLKLYDLRREEVMRKARNYVGMEFWPANVDEFREIHKPTNPNNVFWRQVISFYEMIAQLPLHGAVDTELFLATQGEGVFLRAKFAEVSEEATGNTFMPNTKKLIDSSEKAQAQFEAVRKQLLARRAQVVAAKA
ncbi:hypothetical protein [Terriglobus sp. RCC_193]|uniref:DUF4760 domain-containing protein n=1 Tax=Terriglobus sp. RCC_193 TaxID=3239218 RepID=UPI0035248B03